MAVIMFSRCVHIADSGLALFCRWANYSIIAKLEQRYVLVTTPLDPAIRQIG
jgi:hypothetical protein